MPGGRLLAVGGEDGYLALVDPRRGAVVERLRGHNRYATLAPSFSADGRRMLTISPFDTVLLWTLQGDRPTGPPRRYGATGGVGAAALSPDGRSFAATGPLGVDIVDAQTLEPRGRLPGSDTVQRFVSFTPDGRFLVGGSVKGWTRVWSSTTYKPVTRPLTGHTSDVVAGSTSPDGRTLAIGSLDGKIILYDLRTQRPIGAPLPAVANRVVAPEFSPDGAYLYGFTQAGRQYRWDVRPVSWERRACAIAGRTLTRTEWNDALPGREYRPACAG
jgi:WD40 repeat protein